MDEYQSSHDSAHTPALEKTEQNDPEATLLFTQASNVQQRPGNASEQGENVKVVENERTLIMVTPEQQTIIQQEKKTEVILTPEEAEQVLVEVEEEAVRDVKTIGMFWLKFLNDWIFAFASGLAYHLLTAMFPIAITLLIIAGLISGEMSQHDLVLQLNRFFPSILASQGAGVLEPVLHVIRKDVGWLSVVAVVIAIFSGSRLFISIEDTFDIIYHTPARPFLQQNLMAITMMLIFMALIPLMLLASSISESLDIGEGLGGFLIGLVTSWLLFEAIYLFVPNQRISLRNSWLGSLVAALALQLYVSLFPLYAEHFLGSYTGNAGFAVILLIFFYYFAVILLLGAEVNAFFAENIRPTLTNIAGIINEATSAADEAIAAERTRKLARERPVS